MNKTKTENPLCRRYISNSGLKATIPRNQSGMQSSMQSMLEWICVEEVCFEPEMEERMSGE